ncbi:cardiolipin synthase [Natranaerovirga pectinivora]|uniref:Cardiolipin synthase n=1 Tax=Natranaerovirga pectinivora TaxID=682400 RepID=A0A4R3MNH7_9FIRM|nr:cardiolipin synthase [Natranaerovirga pectinivora]TCT16060.1 cardiolipin synthase [Natranaerovirga pectinivora]
MKILKIINNRILITSVILLVQMVWFIIFLIRLTRYYAWVSAIFSILSILIVLYIIKKDDNASFKIGWIILIMALPLSGALFYLFFGNKRASKAMHARLSKEYEKTIELIKVDQGVLNEIGDMSERVLGTARYIHNKSFFPIYKNTATTYYPLGETMYGDMLLELEKAERFIFLQYFIIEEGKMWDGILNILTKKVAEGVDVRLIYDDVGSLFVLPNDFSQKMERIGIKCMAFNKVRPILSVILNNRDHRKILIIDGHTAFNGGINLADEYINEKLKFGHWKDTGVRLKGEGVWSFTLMFLEMWNAFKKSNDVLENFKPPIKNIQSNEDIGYVQPFSDSPFNNEAIGENIYIELLSQAKRYVYIFTPYLIIDNEMKSALCMAAKRGVDVRIVTPGIPDKKIVFRLTRSNYLPLLKAGVKIYEYTPGFIHGKSYVCDDELGVVGTINMDYRSLYLHFECGTFLYKTPSIMDLKKDSLETIDKSKEIKVNNCKQGLFGSLFDAVLRVFAPLF